MKELMHWVQNRIILELELPAALNLNHTWKCLNNDDG